MKIPPFGRDAQQMLGKQPAAQAYLFKPTICGHPDQREGSSKIFVKNLLNKLIFYHNLTEQAINSLYIDKPYKQTPYVYSTDTL